MSRNNTQALHSIRMMCRMQQVDEKVLYDRSRLILPFIGMSAGLQWEEQKKSMMI